MSSASYINDQVTKHLSTIFFCAIQWACKSSFKVLVHAGFYFSVVNKYVRLKTFYLNCTLLPPLLRCSSSCMAQVVYQVFQTVSLICHWLKMEDSWRQFLRESFYLWFQRFILLQVFFLVFLLSLLISSLLKKKAMDSDTEDSNSSELKPHLFLRNAGNDSERNPSVPLYPKQSALKFPISKQMFISTGCTAMSANPVMFIS